MLLLASLRVLLRQTNGILCISIYYITTILSDAYMVDQKWVSSSSS